jgi:hypothetical protein
MMSRIRTGRERLERILIAMYKLADGATNFLKYEDIVVKAYQMFPDEFAMRGHPEYPDSSDIHKPLYGVLKRRGLIKSAQKQFALTPRGIQAAEKLVSGAGENLEKQRSPERLARDVQLELDRMLSVEAFRLFCAGEKERILDTDFYTFLGCTVRTGRNDFIGRVNACEAAIQAALKLAKPDLATARRLAELFKYSKQRFKKEIDWKVGKNG